MSSLSRDYRSQAYTALFVTELRVKETVITRLALEQRVTSLERDYAALEAGSVFRRLLWVLFGLIRRD